jgi:hypothetical protein
MRTTVCFAGAATAMIAASMMLTYPALARPLDSAPADGPTETRLHYVEHTTSDILTQPIRDAGLIGVDIPDPLVRARKDPYALPETSSCDQIGSEIGELNSFLGPELISDTGSKESRVSKLAEAGGRAAVNSLIPFRTLVREVSGAAPAQRRLQEAIDLGYARRGFLRAVYRMRRCPSGPDGGGDPQNLMLSLAH